MNKKRNSLLVIVLLLLVGLTFGYVSSTYAKYTSKVDSGEGSATVAKWAFSTDNASTSTTLEVKFTDTYDATTLDTGKIAPGTSGHFDVKLVNTNTETGVRFSVKLKSAEDVPTNLKFYKDASFTTEMSVANAAEITGKLAAKDSTGVTVPIYWKWLYETPAGSEAGDSADTADGEAANTLKVKLEIVGTQVEPSATEITSGLDA